MFDKRDVARLIEQLEAERVQLTRRGVELQKQVDQMQDELKAIDGRGALIADLVEKLSHYHDNTTPDSVSL